MSFVADTNWVGLSDPLNFTTELDMKLSPLTVIAKPWLPTFFDDGVMFWMLGIGFERLLITENVLALEAPPSGEGLKTVMVNVPAMVRSDDGIWAVSWAGEA